MEAAPNLDRTLCEEGKIRGGCPHAGHVGILALMRSRRVSTTLRDNWPVLAFAAIVLGTASGFLVNPWVGAAAALTGAVGAAVLVLIIAKVAIWPPAGRGKDHRTSPWPDDPPLPVQACPRCGGEVAIGVANMIRIGSGPEQWCETGFCKACRAHLVRELTEIDKPVVLMGRSDWRISGRS